MATMVVRMKRVAGVGGALGSHIDGKTRPESAAPRTVHVSGADFMLEPVVHFDGEGNRTDLETVRLRRQDAQSYMDRCRKRSTDVAGRKPMGAVTFVFAGPPRYDGEKEPPWDGQTVSAWAADVVKLTVERAGRGSRLAECSLHQDEGAPHLHLSMVVADEEGRLGWNRVRERFVPRDFKPARGAKRRTLSESKRLMSGLQDVYYEEVGRKYGLGRGEVGSDREHAPVDRAKGIQIRVEEERRRAERAVEDRDKAASKREKAVSKQEAALKRRAAALEKRESAVERGDRSAARYRTERDQARGQVRTVTAERDQARGQVRTVTAERDVARGQVRTVTAERDAAFDRFGRTAKSLAVALGANNAGRAGVEKIADVCGIDGPWLVREVERSRGMDR